MPLGTFGPRALIKTAMTARIPPDAPWPGGCKGLGKIIAVRWHLPTNPVARRASLPKRPDPPSITHEDILLAPPQGSPGRGYAWAIGGDESAKPGPTGLVYRGALRLAGLAGGISGFLCTMGDETSCPILRLPRTSLPRRWVNSALRSGLPTIPSPPVRGPGTPGRAPPGRARPPPAGSRRSPPWPPAGGSRRCRDPSP